MWCGQKNYWIIQDVSVAYVVQYEVADELEKMLKEVVVTYFRTLSFAW
jgi:hypothetical protein